MIDQLTSFHRQLKHIKKGVNQKRVQKCTKIKK